MNAAPLTIESLKANTEEGWPWWGEDAALNDKSPGNGAFLV